MLDDQTFAALQSVMLMNNVEILFKLQQDPNFFPDLFKKLKTTPPMVSDPPWSGLHAGMITPLLGYSMLASSVTYLCLSAENESSAQDSHSHTYTSHLHCVQYTECLSLKVHKVLLHME